VSGHESESPDIQTPIKVEIRIYVDGPLLKGPEDLCASGRQARVKHDLERQDVRQLILVAQADTALGVRDRNSFNLKKLI
jgi:hypothetical protein